MPFGVVTSMQTSTGNDFFNNSEHMQNKKFMTSKVSNNPTPDQNFAKISNLK